MTQHVIEIKRFGKEVKRHLSWFDSLQIGNRHYPALLGRCSEVDLDMVARVDVNRKFIFSLSRKTTIPLLNQLDFLQCTYKCDLKFCNDPKNQLPVLINFKNYQNLITIVPPKGYHLTQVVMFLIRHSDTWFDFNNDIACLQDFDALVEFGINEPMIPPDLILNSYPGYLDYQNNRECEW